MYILTVPYGVNRTDGDGQTVTVSQYYLYVHTQAYYYVLRSSIVEQVHARM